MLSPLKSCAVALPSQRNCATSENSATLSATRFVQTGRKPASIRELRTQLQAQRLRNHAALVHATGTSIVAQETDTSPSCAVALPSQRNCATDLIREFMEVDGLSEDEAHVLAAVSVLPRPPVEWLALIQELDVLIDRYCQTLRLSDDVRTRLREVRKKQSLSAIPLAVDWFRRELSTLSGNR